jgi:ligand-binding sensor domain-containing protein
MNLFKSLFFLTLIFSLLGATNAQEWVSYQSQQQVNDLVDNGDELIMATDAGLVVMNKTTLEKTIFNTSNSNLSNNHIQSITQAPNGDTFIGTYDVVMGLFDGSDIQNVIIPEGIDNPNTIELYDIEITPNGDLWVGTSEGVFRKQGQDWTKYDETDLGEFFFKVWDIEFDSAGDVYIGAQNGVHKFEDGLWSNISSETSLLGYLDAELFFSESGDLYFAGDLDSIGRYDGENWELYSNGGLNGSQITGFTEDVEGNVYFNFQDLHFQGYNSIFKLENNAWMPYTDIQIETYGFNSSYYHIDDQNIRWLNNNIYLSANDNGSISSTSISSTTIEYNNVYRIHKGLNGDMFFISFTSTNRIAVVDPDGNWSSFELPSSNNLLAWPIAGDILFIAEDDIWLTSYEGLYHYDGNEWSLNEFEGCNRLALDSQGKIYVAATDRIYIIENGIISEYNTSNSVIAVLEVISGLGVDADDNLWIASFSWDGDNVIQKVAPNGSWTTYDGEDHPVIIRPEGDFHFDINGNVWISAQPGVIKFDGQNFTNPIMDNISNLESYKAFSIESDSEGRMYFAHQYGVTTLLDGVWEELLIDDVPHVNSSTRSNIKFDDAGTLWWASKGYGVFSYTPENTTSVFPEVTKTSNFSVYPNPTNNFTNLQFTANEKTKVKVYVYNNLGQVVSSFDFGIFNQGDFQQVIDLGNIPNGVYSIQLFLNSFSSTKTVIKY